MALMLQTFIRHVSHLFTEPYERTIVERIARVPEANLAKTVLRSTLSGAREELQEVTDIAELDVLLDSLSEDFPLLDNNHLQNVCRALRRANHPELANALLKASKYYQSRRQMLGLTQGEINETVALAGSVDLDKIPPEPVKTPPKRYNDIATALGGIGTFGGAITFAALLQLGVSCSDNGIRNLLAYASVLFLGSILAIIPVILALGESEENHDIPDKTLRIVWFQMGIAGTMDVSALVCLLLVIRDIGLPGPFFIGLSFLVATFFWGLIALATRLHHIGIWLQIIITIILLLLCILTPTGKIPTVQRMDTTDPCNTPAPSLGCPTNCTIALNSSDVDLKHHSLDMRWYVIPVPILASSAAHSQAVPVQQIAQSLFKHQRYLVSQFVRPSVGHTHGDLLEPLLRQRNYRLEELSHTISTARRQKQ